MWGGDGVPTRLVAWGSPPYGDLRVGRAGLCWSSQRIKSCEAVGAGQQGRRQRSLVGTRCHPPCFWPGGTPLVGTPPSMEVLRVLVGISRQCSDICLIHKNGIDTIWNLKWPVSIR